MDKLKARRDRIVELLSATPNTLAHRGGDRVVRQLKKELKDLNRKLKKAGL